MLKEIPFGPGRAVGADEKYLIAVDQPTLEYLEHRNPKVEFYPLGTYAGFDVGSGRAVKVTVIANVLPK
jgi:hypothetical protein